MKAEEINAIKWGITMLAAATVASVVMYLLK